MGLFATMFGAWTGVTGVCYMRALSKMPYFSKPWEHALALGLGVWGAHKFVLAEEWCEETVHRMIVHKMERNQGVLDEKYREILGSKFDQYVPAKAAAAAEASS